MVLRRQLLRSANLVFIIRRVDCDLIVDSSDPRRVGSRPLRDVSLQPRADMSGQRHDVAGRMSLQMTRIQIRVAVQGLDNPLADVPRGGHRSEANPVDDATHAADVSHRLLRILALEFPHNFASQRDVAMMNRRLHVVGHRAAQLERADDISSDIGVGPTDLGRTSMSLATARTPRTRLAARSAASLP